MKAMSLCVALVVCASSVSAQERGPIRASMQQAAMSASATADDEAQPKPRQQIGSNKALFWSGLAIGVAGVTTSTLGLTALRTDRTSTGNAPDAAYRNCVAQRDSDPIYAANQCGALKGKNLRLLWSGVAIGGAGAALMVLGRNTRAELGPDHLGVFHRWRF
jgi:hypothetical protein